MPPHPCLTSPCLAFKTQNPTTPHPCLTTLLTRPITLPNALLRLQTRLTLTLVTPTDPRPLVPPPKGARRAAPQSRPPLNRHHPTPRPRPARASALAQPPAHHSPPLITPPSDVSAMHACNARNATAQSSRACTGRQVWARDRGKHARAAVGRAERGRESGCCFARRCCHALLPRAVVAQAAGAGGGHNVLAFWQVGMGSAVAPCMKGMASQQTKGAKQARAGPQGAPSAPGKVRGHSVALPAARTQVSGTLPCGYTWLPRYPPAGSAAGRARVRGWVHSLRRRLSGGPCWCRRGSPRPMPQLPQNSHPEPPPGARTHSTAGPGRRPGWRSGRSSEGLWCCGRPHTGCLRSGAGGAGGCCERWRERRL